MAQREVNIETAKEAVLAAFLAAKAARRPAHECYKAGVDVWTCLYPEHSIEHAAKQAVNIMLAAVEDELMTGEHEGARQPGAEPPEPSALDGRT